MSGWTAAILGLVLVTNPPGLARLAAWGPRRPDRRHGTVTAIVVATGVLAGVASVTGPLLDALDLSGPTFRLGAAVVVGITGARWFLTPAEPVTTVVSSREGVAHLLVSFLAPGPVFAAMAANSDAGAAAALVAVAMTVAVCAAMLAARRLPDPWGAALARLVGAATVVVAVAVGIDSARSV